jgi:hypothetical protein
MIVISILICLIGVGIVGWTPFKTFSATIAPAWVQALGSVGTIICGFVYIDRTNHQQLEREAAAAKAIKSRQIQAVLAVCEQAGEALNWTNVAGRSGVDEVTIAALRVATMEALAAAKTILFSEIPDEELLRGWGQLRKNLVTLLIHCETYKANNALLSREYLTQILPSLTRDLNFVIERAQAI